MIENELNSLADRSPASLMRLYVRLDNLIDFWKDYSPDLIAEFTQHLITLDSAATFVPKTADDFVLHNNIISSAISGIRDLLILADRDSYHPPPNG
jgi:hypothetical protein